jgi:hypothetical protein
MSDEYKKRIKAAVLSHSARQLKSLSPKRKNMKPEKLVETECLLWMRSQGWDVSIYESKATYNPAAGRYISSSMRAGTADCMGTTNQGIAVFIEFKAKGKLSTFGNSRNFRQQEFLISKINHGAFSCVVDSVDILKAYYIQWMKIRDENTEAAKQFLFINLPKIKNPVSFLD